VDSKTINKYSNYEEYQRVVETIGSRDVYLLVHDVPLYVDVDDGPVLDEGTTTYYEDGHEETVNDDTLEIIPRTKPAMYETFMKEMEQKRRR
jgi:hypothetical protein